MREKELSTRIVFVRHGATDFPQDRIYCDNQEDPELNQSGIAQASEAAGYLGKVKVDAIYASPCLRTQMTAKAVATAHPDAKVVFDEALRERHFGVWEGLYFEQIERDFPQQYQEWKENQANFKPEGGESVYDLVDRVVPKVRSIVERHRGETIVVVAHVGPIRVSVAAALGMPLETYRQLRIDPASITAVDYGVVHNNLIMLNFHGRHWLG